jgi:SagB-type dehydrogenase family enzyme
LRKGIGHKFILNTRWKGVKEIDLGGTDQSKNSPNPPLEIDYDKNLERMTLTEPTDLIISPQSLREVIENRTSIRNYSNTSLTLSELSWLLWATQGVRKIIPKTRTYRNVPSAGARHPFETYLAINRVNGLTKGLYKYLALDHELLRIREDKKIVDNISEFCWNQTFIKNSAIVFIWVFVPCRTTWRFGERGYRNIIEAGHICQNLYLSVSAIDCGVCGIICFGDEKMNQLIGVDGEGKLVIYLATVGKKEN